MNRWIVFYASNHGFGHLTRVMAIIDRIMEISDLRVSLVSGSSQCDFARVYLSRYGERIEIREAGIDVGIICYPDSLEVDSRATSRAVREYLSGLESLAEREFDTYRGRDIRRVIVDISVAGILLSRRLGVPSTLITNFTWCEQYEHLGIDRDIIDVFEEFYRSCDEIIEYDISLGMDRYGKTNKTGVLSREVDPDMVSELRKKYGRILMVSCGKSATLRDVSIRNFPGTIIRTSGIEVRSDSPVIDLPLTVLNTQDYIAASEAVITKAGWGTIGEGLVGHTPLILLKRDVREDTEMTRILEERGLALSVDVEELADFDYTRWERRIDTETSSSALGEIRNSSEDVARMII